MRTLLKPLCLVLLLTPAVVLADTLVIDKVQADAQSASERPLRGMSAADVLARFGQPQAQQPAVGEPPIARWDYEGYSVYFEGSHVLHTVLRH